MKYILNYFKISLFGLLWLVIAVHLGFAQYPHMLNPSVLLDAKSGLPDEYITCMTADDRGYLWIGTRTGLVRYDGTNCSVWQKAEHPALASDWVISLLFQEREHRLWIGTSEGLNYLDLGSGELHQVKSIANKSFDLNKKWITGLLDDGDEGIWVYNAGLQHWSPKEAAQASYFNKYAANSDVVTQVIRDRKNKNILWVGSNGGLSKFDSRMGKYVGFFPFETADSALYNRVNQIENFLYQDTDGFIYSAALGGGMLIFDPETERQTLFSPLWDGRRISPTLLYKSIVKVNDSTLCLGGDMGMLWYNTHTRQLDNFIPNTKYQLKTITPTFTDKDGRIWISTKNGLEGYDPYFNQIRAYDFDATLMPDKFITTRMLEDTASKRLLFIQNGGNAVYQYALTRDVFLKPIDAMGGSNLSTVDLTANRAGKPFLLDQNRLFALSEDKWQKWGQTPALNTPPYISLCFSPDDKLVHLLTIYEGMYALDLESGKTTHYDSSYFYDVGIWLKEAFYDNKHRLWVNHLNIGFTIFDKDGRGYEIAEYKDHLPRKINRMRDQLWLNDSILLVCGGKQGLGLIHRDHPEKGEFRHFVKGEAGLVTDHVYALEKDGRGNVWLLGDRGLEKYLPDRDSFVYYSYPDERFVMNTDVIDQIGFRMLSDGRMVFPYPEGLAFFNPETIQQNDEMLTPLISEILVLDEQMDSLRAGQDLPVFQYDENRMSFMLSAVSFSAPQDNHFLYKLEGADERWGKSRANQRIKYSNLSPGSYTLRVKAANNDLVPSMKVASFSFMILPPWWQTWWAYLLYFTLGLGAFLLWDRNRRRKWQLAAEVELHKQKLFVIEKQKELDVLNAVVRGEEKERMRLSRELHDSVGAMMASIKIYFQLLVKKHPDLEKDQTFNKTKELIAGAYTEVRTISHNLMPIEIYEIGLEQCIEDLCETYSVFDDLELDCRMYLMGYEIPKDIQIHLYRIVQEVIKNAYQHGKAKNIDLQLSVNDSFIHLEIENDGAIFDVEEAFTAGEGIGLKNIETRVKYLNGRLEVVSNEKYGTIFSIFIPVEG